MTAICTFIQTTLSMINPEDITLQNVSVGTLVGAVITYFNYLLASLITTNKCTYADSKPLSAYKYTLK